MRPARVTAAAAIFIATIPATAGLAPARPGAIRFTYAFEAGTHWKYNITGFFRGKFPPFSQPDSPPINLLIRLVYSARVASASPAGATVNFTVEKADLVLLEKDPGPTNKVKPEEETPFPIALTTIQQALDVKAVIRPDGTVVDLEGGDAAHARVDIGVDSRKLFLLMLPVQFPQSPVAPAGTWSFDDGLLGRNPGMTSYTGRLADVAAGTGATALTVDEEGKSVVNAHSDADGKATTAAKAVENTTGTVAIDGHLVFRSPSTGEDCPGQLRTGHLNLTVNLVRKRTAPDPHHPEVPMSSPIAFKARLAVTSVTGG